MTIRLSKDQPLTIAIHAIGGQGGGVIAGWIVALAEANGWIAQSTSVPGVAQRTGATIYYVELAKAGGSRPVMGLMPAPGAVDLVVAAEWMEAGRAVQRGFVSPDRTVLIASTHRGLSVAEKSVPGNGIGDPAVIELAASATSLHFIKADFAAIARENGSVISASLFGAIAGSGALPFGRDAFELAIRQGGVGVEASLRAFSAAFKAVDAPEDPGKIDGPASPDMIGGSEGEQRRYDTLLARLTGWPQEVTDMVRRGVARVIDYQDVAYGDEYLDRLEPVLALDCADQGWQLSIEMAKYLAGAMAYSDVIRVADLKTRAMRSDRVREDAAAAPLAPVTVTEFMHPRIEEMRGLLPVSWERFADSAVMTWALGLFAGGKRLRSDTVTGFLQLYWLAGLRGRRPGTIRHAEEMTHLARWSETVLDTAPDDYALAVEFVRCRRLIKGYSDTHARGLSKYDRVMDGIGSVRHRKDAAEWASRLIAAALQDAEGKALDGALRTIDDFKQEVA